MGALQTGAWALASRKTVEEKMSPGRKRLHGRALPGAGSSVPKPCSQALHLWETKGNEGRCASSGRPFSSRSRGVSGCPMVRVGLGEMRFLLALSVLGSGHFPLKDPRILPIPRPHPTKKRPLGCSIWVLTPARGQKLRGPRAVTEAR